MRFQPNRNYRSNDEIQTPRQLAKALVRKLAPVGRILEPCAGEGAFLDEMPGASWCEILQGRDFLSWSAKVDWIVTNPPWSRIRTFLQKSFEIADNVAFLMTVNHAWTKARLRDASNACFGIRRIIIFETPRSFPQSGFQLGMVVYQRGWSGAIQLEELPGKWD